MFKRKIKYGLDIIWEKALKGEPEKHAESFRQETCFLNLARMKVILIFFLVLASYLVYYDFQNMKFWGNKPELNFLWLDWTLIGVLPLFFILMYVKKPKTPNDISGFHFFFVPFVCASLLVFFAMEASIQQMATGNIVIYIVGAFIIALGVYLKGWVLFVVYCSSLVTFMLTTAYLQEGYAPSFEIYTLMTLVIIALVVTSSLLFNARKQKFISQKEISITNEKLLIEIDERKKAQLEIQKAKAELEVRVVERTAELARTNEELQNEINERKQVRRELKKAKDAAESANKAKSNFLARMSHEIRTPMNGVIGMTSLMMESKLSTEQRAQVETIRSSGEVLLNIINDILDFSKIEAGKLSLESIPFNLREIGQETIVHLTPSANSKGIRLIYRYQPGAPQDFVGDPGRIWQVIINLASNALKFTRQGHVFIDISASKGDNNTAEIAISVEDSGIGIPQEKLNTIFEIFTQADNSTTRSFGGTGLGLTICKQLVELMGGSITVNSVEGKGAQFGVNLNLPLVRDAVARKFEPINKLSLKKILLVDNNAISAGVVVELLKSWNINTIHCETGENAISTLITAYKAKDPFKIALVDYSLPGMNGEEFGRAVREISALKDTMLILMSDFGIKRNKEELAGNGFTVQIKQPVEMEELYQVISALDNGNIDLTGSKPEKVEKKTRGLISKVKQTDPAFKLRVLVVDDHIVNQQVAEKILRKFGCDVDVAGNGRDALELISIIDYDLIFMDCEMPELDGYETTREIRQNLESKQHIPIIAMTAHALKGDREKCLQSGMDDYLPKPVKMEPVQAILKKWSSKKQTSESPVIFTVKEKESKHVGNSEYYHLESQVLSQLRVLAENDVNFFIRVIDIYYLESSKAMSSIENAISSQDYEQIRSSSHGLIGTSGNIGAYTMVKICEDIENSARAKDLAKIKIAYNNLKAESGEVKKELEHEMRILQDKITENA